MESSGRHEENVTVVGVQFDRDFIQDNYFSRNSEWEAQNDDLKYHNYDVRGHGLTPSLQLLIVSQGTGEMMEAMV
ncbi:hypothetical protein PsorP6_015191 [Peronosclerospora sorghi]|uniref:Uncharacterized protein n=1 Tax=Peronosclerospora sorghi TaxID=230839 RepID=A0ACC0VTK6_9STRA|nr:hypothetical protein PsorP6_015191 [Peronosclerospora sorghi]